MKQPSTFSQRAYRAWLVGAGTLAWGLIQACAAPALTFNRDIAPIIFANCSGCHRPGQPAPFSLLNYDDVKRHARQIAEVTGHGFMPPWLPEGGHRAFMDERRLQPDQIQALKTWLEAGTPEGKAGELPPLPHWPEGWQLGPPDLIVRMPRPYALESEGYDVYRNFVIPVPIQTTKYVRAVEFHPGPGGIVHHAFIRVDRRGLAQTLDGQDGQPGFGGMKLPEGVETPSGYFLSWQPGKVPSSEAPGFGWTLQPGQNLVMEGHLKPSGKKEHLQTEVGLYFTDIEPTNSTVVFSLGSLSIDVPPDNHNYLIEDEFILPIPVKLLRVLPHAHYLGKRLEGTAILPGGAAEVLIRIPDWDFNWQGDYRYAEPLALPAGTVIRMKFQYDNSKDNPRNPNSPPKSVTYGPNSADEMAELWFQALVQGPGEAALLKDAYKQKQSRMVEQYAAFRISKNPHDAGARTELGFIQMSRKDPASALAAFALASREDPKLDLPHYYTGLIYRTQEKTAEAIAEFEIALKLNPKNGRAHGNLGFLYMQKGNLSRAEGHLREAVKLDPSDDLARNGLDQIRNAKRRQ